MSELPRCIVVRAHPDLPAGFLPPEQEGRWYGEELLPLLDDGDQFAWGGGAVAVRTDRFERRKDDGMTARVYEVRP